MSTVSNILLICYGDNAQALSTVNDWLANHKCPPLVDIASYGLEGGNKPIEIECWAGAFSRLRIDEFLNFVNEQDWDSDTLLVLKAGHDEFCIQPHGRNHKSEPLTKSFKNGGPTTMAEHPLSAKLREYYPGMEAIDLLEYHDAAADELDRMHTLLNTPEFEDFSKAVQLEAAHQVNRFGEPHDRAKKPQDWFWLLGYHAGKVLAALKNDDRDKALHHCISSGAVMCNWHMEISGKDTGFTPGASDIQEHVEHIFGPQEPPPLPPLILTETHSEEHPLPTAAEEHLCTCGRKTASPYHDHCSRCIDKGPE